MMSMPRIGLDIRMIRHTGIGTYLQGLLQGFETSFPSGWDLARKSFSAPIYSLQEQFAYPSRLAECDLWHAPHYNIPYFKKKVKLVVTVHDLIHWIYRKEFFSPVQALYAQTMFRRLVETADHMIAVSNNTTQDLVTHFQADPKRISVIYEAVGNECQRIQDPERISDLRLRNDLPEKFFLYVGSLKPHKNVQTLLRVFRNLKKNHRLRSGLVIIGRKDRAYRPELRDLQNLRTGEGIWYFPETERGVLTAFYSTALALVHLSLYEGFGLTPLEAMACGTPVIASKTSSIPEVVGDAAWLVDPLDENQIAQALQQIEADPDLSEELRQKGLERLKLFSWEKTARQTLDVYQKVLEA